MTTTTRVSEYLYTAGWRPTPHHADAWNDPRTVLFVLAILLLLAGSLCLAIAGAPR